MIYLIMMMRLKNKNQFIKCAIFVKKRNKILKEFCLRIYRLISMFITNQYCNKIKISIQI